MTINQQRLIEFVGTALLVMLMIGSSITVSRINGVDSGLILLVHSLVLCGGIYLLIQMFKPGVFAQFNPIVTLFFLVEKKITLKEAISFILAQAAGGFLGLMISHLMFNQPLIQASTRVQNGLHNYISEAVATFGLLLTIWSLEWNFDRVNAKSTSAGIAIYVFCMIWFTDCTWYANPLTGFIRSFTNNYLGVSSVGAMGFILAQLLGFALFVGLKRLLKHSS